jgi:hypothetical protein
MFSRLFCMEWRRSWREEKGTTIVGWTYEAYFPSIASAYIHGEPKLIIIITVMYFGTFSLTYILTTLNLLHSISKFRASAMFTIVT